MTPPSQRTAQLFKSGESFGGVVRGGFSAVPGHLTVVSTRGEHPTVVNTRGSADEDRFVMVEASRMHAATWEHKFAVLEKAGEGGTGE
eukprot:8775489-Pyramimonas_sp.AAC.2